MKKIVYTIGLMLGVITVGQAQTKLLETSDEMAGIALVGDDMLLITKKAEGGQYLYTARLGEPEGAVRAVALNAGQINAVIGGNLATGEVFVYHKSGRTAAKISTYKWTNGEFVKGQELPVPRLRNHSYTLGMHLTEDRRYLYLSAELAGSQGYDDLYRSEWNGKSWSRPRNLGRQVNSREAEFAPFVSNDSLYFSRQQGELAYIYGAALRNGQPGKAIRLPGVVNEERYNAYFTKHDDRTVWVTGTTKESPRYIAYMLGGQPAAVVSEPLLEEEVPEQLELEEVVAVAEKAPVRAVTPSLVLYNEFNRVHLSLKELAGLSRFLRQQPDGTSFVIKGYSDGYGEPAAKERVSEQRARSVQNYIHRYFAAKGFQVEVESEVLPEKGKTHRKTELYLVQ